MRLVVLVTNTDDSAFARARDDDAVKFARLVALARPDWAAVGFDVWRGVFPPDLSGFDGAIITGSPASVLDAHPWVADLMALIRRAEAARFPLFGACFGHQAIALALEGRVGPNPGGWSLGLVAAEGVEAAPWLAGLPDPLPLYAAHKEQVLLAPDGARMLWRGPGCPNGGFAIGRHVFTTQYHPEILPEFMADLLEELGGHVPGQVLDRARASLAGLPATAAMAESVARFFEQAR